MCGIWGSMVTRPESFAWLDVWKRAAVEADRRGAHAWGTARLVRDRVVVERHVGGYDDRGLPHDATTIIANHRLATSGMTQDWKDPESNQPVSVGDVAVAHNGIVRNVDQVRYRCDSLFIAEQIAVQQGDLRTRVERAMTTVRSDGPHAALVLSPEGIVTFRQGAVGISPHPLFVHREPWGVVVCSRPLSWADDEAEIGAAWLAT